jgi:hypothetical protein
MPQSRILVLAKLQYSPLVLCSLRVSRKTRTRPCSFSRPGKPRSMILQSVRDHVNVIAEAYHSFQVTPMSSAMMFGNPAYDWVSQSDQRWM